ncbi:MAG: hypothetical protein CL843_03235 [Crocinitomicaceae bacterium]|nr:hypothetical protein [Crocinitomicaceae bacterium]|tara:strand:+ start:523 stop:762 length:240 start_codon:yes stop_codon:yes gene_type:complete
MNADEVFSVRIKAIGLRIKELRKSAGYTSYETFAVKNDLDRKHYWRMENGQNISMKSLFKIIDIHQITIQEFFDGLPLE